MVPAMGFMRDLGQGQDDNLLGRSWQPPEGFAVSSLAAAGGNLGVPASLASEEQHLGRGACQGHPGRQAALPETEAPPSWSCALAPQGCQLNPRWLPGHFSQEPMGRGINIKLKAIW